MKPSALKDFPHIYTCPVVWGDIDRLGHVNNVRYYDYAQEARIGYMNAVLPSDKYTVIVATACQYMSEVVYPDTLKVGVKLSKIGTTSLSHEIVYYSTAQEKIVAKGSSVVVVMDKNTRQKTPIDDKLRAALERFEARFF